MSGGGSVLVHAGYHKTGTTWLQSGPFEDGELGFTRPWDSTFARRWLVLPSAFEFDAGRARAALAPGIEAAAETGLVPVLSDERLSGSPHAGGYDSATIAHRLARTLPEARVLLVIREQRAAIRSTWKQYVRDGGAAPLAKYLAPRNPAEIPQFRFEHWEYHRLIALYRELFDAERVLVLPFERLAADADAFTGDIAGFAGARGAHRAAEGRYREGREYAGLGAFSLAVKRQANRLLVRNALSPAAPLYVKDHERRFEALDRLVPGGLSRPLERRWRRRVEAAVGERYAASNRETQRLTGLDLAALGYPVSRGPAAPGPGETAPALSGSPPLESPGPLPRGECRRYRGRRRRGVTSALPRVSVVLPVYNGERWLAASVESILGQSFEDFELVVVDDGSRDETPRILANLACRDPRVRVITQETNRGLIATLNHAFSLARGEYLARQDDDDEALPTRLERQVEHLNAHPEIGLLGTDYWRIYEDGRAELRRPPRGDTEIRWRLLFGNVWCHASMMLRREVLGPDAAAPYGDWLYAEDYELWVRLLGRTRGATLPEPLVRYRVHASSICVSNEDAQGSQVDALARRQLGELVPELGKLDAAELAALRRCRRGWRLDRAAVDAAPELLSLWDAFARRSDSDGREVARLRRAWLRRFVASMPVSTLPRLVKSGPLGAACQRAPLTLARALLLTRPRRRLARLRGASR